MKYKIGVLLAGSGVFDGSEIHEATFTLLAIDQLGHQAVCIAPNVDQYHVVDHLHGSETNEKRNVLVESARIARGNVKDLATVSAADLDGLVIPGGFGAAKNLNQWALHGPKGSIHPQVKELIHELVKANKPVAGLCMGPTVIASALAGTGIEATLTVGTTKAPSPYDIAGIMEGIRSLGHVAVERTIEEIAQDFDQKIISAPCYNMEASISQVYHNVYTAVKALVDQVK